MFRSNQSNKRQKHFAAPTDPSEHFYAPSTSLTNQRTLTTPTLATLCGRRFADQLITLHSNPSVWNKQASRLWRFPESLLPRLLQSLVAAVPTFLSHETLIYFLRAYAINLSSDVPGVRKHTLQTIPKISKDLTSLQLSRFDKFDDTVFANLVKGLPRLKTLVLRGCSKVSSKTLESAADTCSDLEILNINHTSSPPLSLLPVVNNCHRLKVIKAAGISSWTDASFAKLIMPLKARHATLESLLTLKVSRSTLSETSIKAMVDMCPNLQRLDASFTSVRHGVDWPAGQLQKLNLSSTSLNITGLLSMITNMSNLRTLSLASMGSDGSRQSVGNSSALTITDSGLDALTGILSSLPHLEKISLAGNTKLGSSGSRQRTPLFNFISRVGRKCKVLNLAVIPGLRSSDLAGLPADDADSPPALQSLILSHTNVDDEAAPWIASCRDLNDLQVGKTKFTEQGVFQVIDACPKLESIDVTSCRGIGIVDRRRVFELWAEDRAI